MNNKTKSIKCRWDLHHHSEINMLVQENNNVSMKRFINIPHLTSRNQLTLTTEMHINELKSLNIECYFAWITSACYFKDTNEITFMLSESQLHGQKILTKNNINQYHNINQWKVAEKLNALLNNTYSWLQYLKSTNMFMTHALLISGHFLASCDTRVLFWVRAVLERVSGLLSSRWKTLKQDRQQVNHRDPVLTKSRPTHQHWLLDYSCTGGNAESRSLTTALKPSRY